MSTSLDVLVSLRDKVTTLGLSGHVPKSLKALFWFLIVWNLPSAPMLWHFQVITPWLTWLAENRLLGHIHPLVSEQEEDPRNFTRSRKFWAHLTHCDFFGFHLSNSSYALIADHMRGPYVYEMLSPVFEIPTSIFALGATTYVFKKEIKPLSDYTVTKELLGYDKKWLYVQSRFTTTDKKGAVTTHCLLLSHVVIKLGRRTVPPARAVALSGFGPDGKENRAIVATLSPKQRARWLVGEEEQKIVVGPVEVGLENKEEWPGQI